MEKMTIKIIVATHKKYRMPSDDIYLPLHVGAEGKVDENGNPLDLGYQKDNVGDNISYLNPSFCELTGLYWAWKNLSTDYIGLVHYRRYFALRKRKDSWSSILSYSDIEPFLGKIKLFVPSKRKYYIETLYSHYAHTHYASHLDKTREIIAKKYPDYVHSFDCIVKQRHGYMFNMMIMEKALLNEYCAWLFDILFALKEQVDTSELSAFQGRCYGRVSEIIFNVWLDYQMRTGHIKKMEKRELCCLFMGKINWPRKIAAFLMAKLFDKKYKYSF